ncbi:hypothetical protein [Chitinimonas sp.]|uniref:hypothetical protein n=1 Tax=Chitinimonas sp. TaxID=1934313 RepID=UPI0035B33F55
MKFLPYSNDTDTVVYIGNVTIPPGQTREVEATLHPDFLAPAAEQQEAPDADPLAELLDHKVADVQAALAGLSVAELERLGELEQAAPQPRKGVLGAIAEAILAAGSKTAENGDNSEGQA